MKPALRVIFLTCIRFSIVVRQVWWKASRHSLFTSGSANVSTQCSRTASIIDSHQTFLHRLPSSLTRTVFALPMRVLILSSQPLFSVVAYYTC